MAAAAPGERRGRFWLAISFLGCPCHLPLTLGFAATMLGGTALGALLREHALLAGLIVTSAWVAGTARGMLLIRRGQRGELVCAVPGAARVQAEQHFVELIDRGTLTKVASGAGDRPNTE